MANAAFDALAPGYDRAFSDTAIGRWLRDRTHQWMEPSFAPGTHVLELGCGTGEDALWLARRGVAVTATDASAGMLDQARVKTRAESNVTLLPLDLNALHDDFVGTFDGVLANFGVLNCVRDRRRLAAWLAARIRPGGRASFAVMGPVCLWEIGWHGLHGEFRTATRRLRQASTFQPDQDGESLTVDYPSPRRLSHEFAPYFRVQAVRGLGLFLPPSDAFGVVERRPRAQLILTALEYRWSSNRIAALFSDHYWIELIRTGKVA